MQEEKDSVSLDTSISTSSDISEFKEQCVEGIPDQIKVPSIEIEILQKGKKNFAKSFNKLLRVDKEAFGDVDQSFILKQFWNSRENILIVAKKTDHKGFLGYASIAEERKKGAYLH